MHSIIFILSLIHVCQSIPLPGLDNPTPTVSSPKLDFQFPDFSMQKPQTNNFNSEQNQRQGQENFGTDNIFNQNQVLDRDSANNINGNLQSQLTNRGSYNRINKAINQNTNTQGIQSANTIKGSQTVGNNQDTLYALSHMSGLDLLRYLGIQTPTVSPAGSDNHRGQQIVQSSQTAQMQNSNAIYNNQQSNNNMQHKYNPNNINQETLQTNPAFMISGGKNNHMSISGNTTGLAQTPDQNMITSQALNNGKSYFDPDKLMHIMMTGNEQPFNPSTYNAKQNYIEAKGWQGFNGETSSILGSVANKQVPVKATTLSKTQHQDTGEKQNAFNPNSLNGAQMNFRPMAMMMSPVDGVDSSNVKFTFDPDRLNSFVGDFKPGQISPIKLNQLQIPVNNDQNFLFNADMINKKLTDVDNNVYSQQKQRQEQKQQEASTQQIATPRYDPNSGNNARMNFFPSAFLTQFTDNGNQQQKANINEDQKKKDQTARPQTAEKAFPNIQSGGQWGSMPNSYDKFFGQILFNADAINQQQRKFDPDEVMRSWFKEHGKIVIRNPVEHRPTVVQLQQHEARKFQVLDQDTADNATTVSVTVTVPQSTKPSTMRTTSIPTETTTTAYTTTPIKPVSSTTNLTPTTLTTTNSLNNKSTTGQPVSNSGFFQTGFNPDAINSAMGQMNFSPGYILGYEQPSNAVQNSQYSSAFNPDSVNKATVNFNSGGLSMMNSGFYSGQSNSGSDVKNSTDQSGFNSMGSFNPAEVNQASMNFDLFQQMGLSSSSTDKQDIFTGIYDPMKTNMQSIQSPFISNNSDNSSSGSNGFFSGNSMMMMMDNSGFIGSFDPNKVNKESFDKGFQNGKSNKSSDNFMYGDNEYMKQFLGAGTVGLMDNSAFIGNFDPSSVNKAVFDPSDVNNIHMNFNPSKMLEKNPGYDKTKAESYTFDPNKINDMKMNFIPPFISQITDAQNGNAKKEHGGKKTNSKSKTPNFVPGLLTGGQDSQNYFNPNKVNNARMHFSPMDGMNQMKSGLSTHSNNTNNNQSTSATADDNGRYGISFDPVAVNNGQMNFNPSAMMGNLDTQSSDTSGASPRVAMDATDSETQMEIKPPYLSHDNAETAFSYFGGDSSHVIGGSEK